MAKVKTLPKTRKTTAPAKKAKPTAKPVTKKKQPQTKPRQPARKKIPAAIVNRVIEEVDEKIRENRRKSDTEAAVSTFDIDFCGIELNIRRRTFLMYYLTPGSPSHNNALQSAINAGYSEETARAQIYKILCEPDIEKIVRANEGLGLKALSEAAKRAINIKIQRAEFDPIDYFEEKEIIRTDKNGEPYTQTVMGLKDLKNMTREQRMAIDGLEVKGNASIPVYLMANRDKSLDDVIKINKEYSKSIDNTGEEETREIIMERVTIRETKRAEYPVDIEYEIIEKADFSEDEDEEDD